MSSDLLQRAFGRPEPIDQRVSDFDFSKVNVKEQTTSDILQCNLAPSYGTLGKDTIASLERDVQIMIVGSLRAVAAIPEEKRTFDEVVATLKQSSLLEPQGAVGSSRVDKLVKTRGAVNAFATSPTATSPTGLSSDSPTVTEVQKWLSSLVRDEDLLRSTKIDVPLIVNIIAQTGMTVDVVKKFQAKPATYEKRLLDIGVFRFPDADHPYIQLYRIKITAWYENRRVFWRMEEKAGLTGEFYSHIFYPRKAIIEKLSLETKEKAVREARELFV